mmetsp:Transcript_6923/g.21444  ORF Transcript_6923/g.21444 Transcript_6923/m.21444 type:complete len:401 (-) Transcript_6923:142-1344(-)
MRCWLLSAALLLAVVLEPGAAEVHDKKKHHHHNHHNHDNHNHHNHRNHHNHKAGKRKHLLHHKGKQEAHDGHPAAITTTQTQHPAASDADASPKLGAEEPVAMAAEEHEEAAADETAAKPASAQPHADAVPSRKEAAVKNLKKALGKKLVKLEELQSESSAQDRLISDLRSEFHQNLSNFEERRASQARGIHKLEQEVASVNSLLLAYTKKLEGKSAMATEYLTELQTRDRSMSELRSMMSVMHQEMTLLFQTHDEDMNYLVYELGDVTHRHDSELHQMVEDLRTGIVEGGAKDEASASSEVAMLRSKLHSVGHEIGSVKAHTKEQTQVLEQISAEVALVQKHMKEELDGDAKLHRELETTLHAHRRRVEELRKELKQHEETLHARPARHCSWFNLFCRL